MARPRIIGIEKVMRNLNKEIMKITGRSMKGLIMSAAIIRRDTEKSSPVTPVDTSNLRASWYTVTATGTPAGKDAKFRGDNAGEMASQHRSIMARQQSKAAGLGKPVVVIGFSAGYGGFVHESKGKKFQRPGSGANFLGSSIDSNKSTIIQTIKSEARIK